MDQACQRNGTQWIVVDEEIRGQPISAAARRTPPSSLQAWNVRLRVVSQHRGMGLL
jgi:hypothetical protein